jgi:radical SAM protein with 4Fe4S-binding SPASM domain
MDVLRRHGVNFGAIVVIAPHTAGRIVEIYDYFEALQMTARFLPLFKSPRSDEPGIAITEAMMCDALKALFNHWIQRQKPIRVSPLYEYCFAVYLHLNGARQAPYDRKQSGEWALLVNTDGEVFQRMDAYDTQRSLGNVFRQPIEQIIASEKYQTSLDRDDAIWRRYCRGCKFQGPCPSIDVFDSPRDDHGNRRCELAYPLHMHILNSFRGRTGPRALAAFLARM